MYRIGFGGGFWIVYRERFGLLLRPGKERRSWNLGRIDPWFFGLLGRMRITAAASVTAIQGVRGSVTAIHGIVLLLLLLL